MSHLPSPSDSSRSYNYDRFEASHYDLADFPGPGRGSLFPDLPVTTTDGRPSRLSAFRGRTVVLETASLTCPMYAKNVKRMARLAERFPQVDFLVVYVREAHPGERTGPHLTLEDKLAAARRLPEEAGDHRPVLVDGLDGGLHVALGSLPNSVYVLDPGGRVIFRGDWTDPSAVERVLEGAATESLLDREHFPPTKPTPPVAIRTLLRGGWSAVWDFVVSLPSLLAQHRRADRAGRSRAAPLLLLTVLLWSSTVGGSTVEASIPEAAAEASAAADGAAEGRRPWTRSWSVGAFGPLDDDREIDAFDLRFGIGYDVDERFTLLGEMHATAFDGTRVLDSGESLQVSTAGVGVAAVARWRLLLRPRWSLFAETGWGLLGTTDDFPPGGSAVNGTSQYGLGVEVRVRERLDLVARARQWHVSNGRGLVEDNPSWDGWGLQWGLRWGSRRADARSPEERSRESPTSRTVRSHFEAHLGDADGTRLVGGRIVMEVGSAVWSLFAEASADDVDGEPFTQVGAGVVRRGDHGLWALVLDRQELDLFTSERLDLQLERRLGAKITSVGLLGHERRNLAEDRWRGALRLRWQPTPSWSVEPGFAFVETEADLGADSAQPSLNLEYAPRALGERGLSFFLQDRVDELLLVGVRWEPGRSFSRDPVGRGVLRRVRF